MLSPTGPFLVRWPGCPARSAGVGLVILAAPACGTQGVAAAAVPVTWGAESSRRHPLSLAGGGTITACQERGHPLGGLGGTVGETRVPADTEAPCLSERRPAETAEPPRRSRTATGTQSSSPLRSEPGSGSTPLTRMTGKKSPAGPLSRTRSSIATERPLETAGETPARSFGPDGPRRVDTVPHARKKSHLRRLRSFQDFPGRRLGESSAQCGRCLGGGAPAGRS